MKTSELQKENTAVAPYSRGMWSETPGRCLRPPVAPNPVYSRFFLYTQTQNKAEFVN